MGKNPENIRRRAKRGECNRTSRETLSAASPRVCTPLLYRCHSCKLTLSVLSNRFSLTSPSFSSSLTVLRRRLIERLCRDTEARRPVAVNTFPGKFEQIFDKTVAPDNMAFDVHVTRSSSIAVDSYTIKKHFVFVSKLVPLLKFLCRMLNMSVC